VSDRLFMPLSSSNLALRARRRSAKGVELELDVDARGWPAVAAVVGSPSWRRRTGQQDLGDQLGPGAGLARLHDAPLRNDMR
jgi:hypothetical protein